MAEKKRKATEDGSKVFPIFLKKAKSDHPSGSSEAVDEGTTRQLSLKEFATLLDFSSVTEQEEISSRFAQISRGLLHDFRLVTRRTDGKETEFKVLEAEFYLQIEGIHEDPFTHGSEEQKLSGRWIPAHALFDYRYFHRAPRRSADSNRSLTSTTEYRSGSRKGMDLTFGAPLPQVISKYFTSEEPSTSSSSSSQTVKGLLRGGILIRTLRQLGPGSKVISGPSLLVDQILSSSGAPSIEDLVENKWEGNISAFLTEEGGPPCRLYLKEVPSEERKTSSKVYFSPRIGLDLSHPGTTGPTTLPLHPRIRFLSKPYRFFVHPEQLVANGRAQTFLGVLQSYIESRQLSLEAGLQKSSLSSEIARSTGLKEATAAKYLTEYKAGRSAGPKSLESVIGPRGKGASSSPAIYLKMMGALSAL